MASRMTADVVVVGCGFAGATSAIAAHDAGARVVVIEKMPDPGGISVCSFGGVRCASDAKAALAYLQRTNGDAAPLPVLKALARGMVGVPRFIAHLTKAVGGTTAVRPAEGNYPFPGADTFGFVTVESLPDFDVDRAYPHVAGAPGGRFLFQMFERNLALRGLVPRTRTAAMELLRNRDGKVVGVRARAGREIIDIQARGGVVLACGGFEGSLDLQGRHWSFGPVLNAAFRGNTGDGIRMAQAAGAELWHMWHVHGSYGFRHPDPRYPFGIRTKRLPDWQPGQELRGDVRVPWILVDKRGRRFMNEYEPYLQDTGIRPFAAYDPVRQRFAALPAHLIADANGLATWPFGRPTSHERGIRYEWSRDNRAEIANGILRLAPTIAALADALQVPEQELTASIARWNAACDVQRDDAFDRPPTSMMPIREPPFVHADVWPIVSNTQGGPVHDARQRILHVSGKPIEGLYVAGEIGSLFGHLYLSGGNIAECVVGGQIAGREAARAAMR